MTYKYADTSHLPAWLRDAPGPVWCRVSSYNAKQDHRYVVWYTAASFLDTRGAYWMTAKPVEAWEPEENEPVIAWEDDDLFADVIPYNKDTCKRTYDYAVRMPDFRLVSLDVEYVKSLRLEEVQR